YFPRQVHGKPEACFRKRKSSLPRQPQSTGRGKGLHCIPVEIVRQDWVVYAKPPFGGPQHCAALFGAIHAPGSHFQPPSDPVDRWPSDVSLERLRPREQEAEMTIAAHEFLRRFVMHVLRRASFASVFRLSR